jgi:hypothetical protein
MATSAAPHSGHGPTHRLSLLWAFALGANPWKRGLTTGTAPRPRARRMPAGAVTLLREERAHAKPRVGLPEDAPILRGNEAGRDGCRLHRCLVTPGVEPQVVDAARLAGTRRHRRAQPARLDGLKGLPMRRRPMAGEWQVWRVGRGPRVTEEDRQPLPRERA